MEELTANDRSEPLETDVYGRASGNFADFPIPTIHTRCPACRKLFAVDALLPETEQPLFQCLACESQFTILMPISLDLAEVESVLIEAAAPAVLKQASTAFYDTSAFYDTRATQSRVATLEVPVQPLPPAGLHKSHETEHNPEVGSEVRPQVLPDEEIFAAELALGAKPELILLWKEIIDDYENPKHHDAFIGACVTTGALTYAAHKYGRILEQFPDEEIARTHRKRLQAIAGAPAETAPEMSKPLLGFRMPGLNSMVIVLGSSIAFIGMSQPGLANMTGVGAAMVALALGLRFFAKRSEI